MMTQPIMEEPPDFSFEFDSLAIPPMDHPFLSATNQAADETLASDLGFPLDGNDVFQLEFEGLDDLYFPVGDEPFHIPSVAANHERSANHLQESDDSGVSGGDCVLEDVDKYLNCWSSESDCCIRESPQESGGEFSGAAKCSKGQSPVSSQGSGNCGSGVFEAINASSPESENNMADQKVKVEETGITSVPKRKKENEDASGESRSSKYHKLSDYGVSCGETAEEDDKKKARLIRNRESAQLSRQRKKHHIEELEDKVRSMHSTIADLNTKISYFMAENVSLKQRLSGGAGICSPPPPGMYPSVAPMPYPWMPCPPYVFKGPGSQVPLVPIPRLKTHQQHVSVSKAKKPEAKKSQGKARKVASISFLGLMFLILLFCGLAPIIDVRYGGITDGYHAGYRSNYITDRFYVQHRGKLMSVEASLDASDGGIDVRFPNSNRVHCERGCDEESRKAMSSSRKNVSVGNNSESLVASLFVPRNNKLVKIDGNLIIHSVLASEKAMASGKASETKSYKSAAVPIPKDLFPALPDVVRSRVATHLRGHKQPKALSSGSADNLKDQFKSTAADGKMQQWFREGVVGPMLSSGTCTEVFQFDVSPTSGAIVPASAATNVSSEHHRNKTHVNMGKNRRILHGLPVPFPVSDSSITKDGMLNASQKDSFQENKPSSSMVVSVLVDPREGGDGDGDIEGMMTPKSVSRIFVVVLVDSVKYMTYSCVLPGSGGLHL